MGYTVDKLDGLHLLNWVTDLCFYIDRGWTYRFINDAALRTTPLERQDFIGARITEIFSGVDSLILLTLKDVTMNKMPRQIEVEQLLPQAPEGRYMVQVYPVAEGALFIAERSIELEDTPPPEEQQDTIRDIQINLTSTLELREVLEQILIDLNRLVMHDAASIILIEETAFGPNRYQEYTLEEDIRRDIFLAIDGEALERITSTQRVTLNRNTAHLNQWESLPLSPWVASYIGIPIYLNDNLIGLLSLASEQVGFFNILHARQAFEFASRTAVAIWNARLFRDEQRERLLAQRLQEMSQAVSKPGTGNEIIDRTMREVNGLFPKQVVSILLIKDDVFTVMDLQDEQVVPRTPFNWLEQIIHKGQAVVEFAPKDDVDHWLDVPGVPQNVRSWIGVPLVAQEEPLGLIGLSSSRSYAFDSYDIHALTIIAQQLSLALFNAMTLDTLNQKVEALRKARDTVTRTAHLSTIGEIAMGIAHQINNPLTAVLAQANLALHFTEEDHRSRKSIVAIQRAAERAANVVQRMFSIRDIDTYDYEKINMREAVESTLALVRADVDLLTTQVKASFDDDLPLIEGSPTHIEDLLLNLVLNARDAVSAQRDGRIAIEVMKDNATRHIVITIADNGPGIPEENLPQIFTPFFTTKSSGTGLGLPICQDIVRHHGGTITVKSKEGFGAEFTVRLPHL